MARRKAAHRPKRVRDGIALDDPDAPVEGSDAGNDADLHTTYVRRRVAGYRAAANRLMAQAQKRVGHAPESAEQFARQALDAATRAFWWAEDTGEEERQHQLIHKHKQWIRKTFGCSLHFDGRNYSRRCPADIAHLRVGLSPGFVADRECSICGGDLSECPHRKGRAYWVRGGSRHGRPCPVCLREQCDHRETRLYQVGVRGVIRNIREVREVSFVTRPAQPEARPAALPVDREKIERALGASFRFGMPVSCDKCIQPCAGFNEYDLATVYGDDYPADDASSA
jgi:hypothetical protein